MLGCSDGAIVAVLTAVQRPDLVRQLVCVAGPFHREGWIPEAIDPANEPPPFFATSYGEISPDGIDHFPVVVDKMARAHLEGPTLTAADLSKLTCRSLVMVSDDDEVPLDHALEYYRALPHGELAVVPGTSHGLLVEKPELCHQIHPRLPDQRADHHLRPGPTTPATVTTLTPKRRTGAPGGARAATGPRTVDMRQIHLTISPCQATLTTWV